MDRLTAPLAILAICFVFLASVGGKLEGIVFPVATDTTISRIEVAPNGSTRIWGQFRLVRPSCDFKGIEWRLSGLNRGIGAAVTFEGGTKEREGGINDFGPWVVQLTEAQLSTSVAVVIHDCPWRFWETQTQFYP